MDRVQPTSISLRLFGINHFKYKYRHPPRLEGYTIVDWMAILQGPQTMNATGISHRLAQTRRHWKTRERASNSHELKKFRKSTPEKYTSFSIDFHLSNCVFLLKVLSNSLLLVFRFFDPSLRKLSLHRKIDEEHECGKLHIAAVLPICCCRPFATNVSLYPTRYFFFQSHSRKLQVCFKKI